MAAADSSSSTPLPAANSGVSNVALRAKRKKLALGAYPQTTLAEARQKRDNARAFLDKGIDPGAAKKSLKVTHSQEQDTFEAIAREWQPEFLPTWAENHVDKIIRRLELYIFPWLGVKPEQQQRRGPLQGPDTALTASLP
ncbi:MAG: integrase arm-type DNA-binding domain-containing protein [Desulfobulbaceae bacterium]|nr:integrase arm-type DNA-binding domain-containing protein [Desulfobulbaceae bacterium]